MATDEWMWSADELKRVGYRTVDLIADYLTGLPERPAFRPYPPDRAASMLDSTPPGEGRSPDAILDEFATSVMPFPFGNGHPRFWGWVNSPPSPLAIYADALAAAMNPSCGGGNHAGIHIERQVVDWYRQIAGFPEGSSGLLVSGGSMATLTALAAARHAKHGEVRIEGLRSVPEMAVYASAQAHGCTRKALELLGLGSNALRTVPIDSEYRMRVDRLEASILADLEAGRTPLAVVASAGTVSTGAIDPLRAIREVCDRRGVWMHVDGAYGGPAVLTAAYRDELAPLGTADSLALDPHKWLYVPVDAGLVLVRDGPALPAAFASAAPYLRADGNPHGVNGPPWFADSGFELTRPFRALKAWMALQIHGTSGYAHWIGRDIDHARYLAGKVEASPRLELAAPQSLSIVCFRYVPHNRDADPSELDELNRKLAERIQLSGVAFVSSTVLDGRFALRACIVNPRSSASDFDALVALAERLGRELESEGDR